ncbi:elongation factor ts dimerization domain superfamily [Holotrichia oblita]|uniref:Elongation factor ts dimerization domain superfamily n=1 Tax=Holotrichia oblita TaxID=644536 RepID=A0ACB9TG48_HOLOL|nr:elongation factor ts dimerization domain superfamily [Holotrichia oblita]
MESYTALRRRREEFRKRLVNLIVSKDEDISKYHLMRYQMQKKEILRYYYYIRHGVDTIHVAPLDQESFEQNSLFNTKKTKKWTDTLAANVHEMKEDFMVAVKKQSWIS